MLSWHIHYVGNLKLNILPVILLNFDHKPALHLNVAQVRPKIYAILPEW